MNGFETRATDAVDREVLEPRRDLYFWTDRILCGYRVRAGIVYTVKDHIYQPRDVFRDLLATFDSDKNGVRDPRA